MFLLNWLVLIGLIGLVHRPSWSWLVNGSGRCWGSCFSQKLVVFFVWTIWFWWVLPVVLIGLFNLLIFNRFNWSLSTRLVMMSLVVLIQIEANCLCLINHRIRTGLFVCFLMNGVGGSVVLSRWFWTGNLWSTWFYCKNWTSFAPGFWFTCLFFILLVFIFIPRSDFSAMNQFLIFWQQNLGLLVSRRRVSLMFAGIYYEWPGIPARRRIMNHSTPTSLSRNHTGCFCSTSRQQVDPTRLCGRETETCFMVVWIYFSLKSSNQTGCKFNNWG